MPGSHLPLLLISHWYKSKHHTPFPLSFLEIPHNHFVKFLPFFLYIVFINDHLQQRNHVHVFDDATECKAVLTSNDFGLFSKEYYLFEFCIVR